ncbi:MAG TPA: HAD hydrolase-like protein [Polyangiaceae bacterium]|jgi:phosphoglycolate phosphatase|nr:HAD hydrolase-like protein [Polyangiaceae bacterium]
MHLFFDLDGTLTDSRPGIMSGMRHALRTIGREEPSDEALLPFIGPPTHDAFRALLGSADPELNARTIRIYREHYAARGWAENSVYPGISAGLRALSEAGFGLWVVTSKPHVFATRIVEHFELGPFFQRVYGSELDGVRSHKGELIAHVLESEGLRAGDTWMIGDRLHDIRGAKQNGLRSAGVLWGYGSREELASEGADAIFAEMPELVRAFTR